VAASLAIAPQVFRRLPGLRVVAAVARGLDAGRASAEIDRRWAYNALSLELVVPAGGYDLTTLKAGLELRETVAGDTFQALDAASPEAVPAGEVAYAHGSTVLTRHLVWRQSRQALITAGTRQALFVSELLPAQRDLAARMRSSLVEALESLLGAAVRSDILSAENPVLAGQVE
jgi:DNA/RNA-binding domain of Phe-tRNA-synthetase-like protein